MIKGMPRFTRVERVAVVGAETVAGAPDVGRRAAGSEEEMMGLLVSRLWINGFFWRLVVIPIESPLSVECDTLAASSGEMSRAEQAGGRRVRQARSMSMFSR